jgi:hypothetical protein
MKATELISFFQSALDAKWGYIWGQWGAVWTDAKQRQKVNYMISKYGDNWKKNANAKNDNYYYAALYGSKWIGSHVADCSGMFRKGYDLYGQAIAHSSNRIWEGYCSSRGNLKAGKRTDGQELKPGTAVFVHPAGKNRTHIGLYIGGGIVIEASGTQAGVISSAITHQKWVEWGELKGVEYEGGDQPMPDKKPMLRKGDAGAYVTLAQTKLIQKGYDCGKWGVDGKFGQATEDAVKRLQKDFGLTTDGIIGPAVWDALEKETPTTILYTVSIPHLTLYKAEALIAQYSGSYMTEERG